MRTVSGPIGGLGGKHFDKLLHKETGTLGISKRAEQVPMRQLQTVVGGGEEVSVINEELLSRSSQTL